MTAPNRHSGCVPRVNQYDLPGPIITKLVWCRSCGALWDDYSGQWLAPMGGSRDRLATLASTLRQTAQSIEDAISNDTSRGD